MITTLIYYVFQALYILLLIRVILSWIPHNAYHPAIDFVYRITDTLLRPFQNIVPPEKVGGLDLSPLFAFFALKLIEQLLFRFLVF